MPSTLDALRRYAVARSLFPPTTLRRALDRFGFVQADPIRAPARAQDLTLRHRVKGYRAGDLEQRYASLAIEEDVFVNYGFLTHAVHRLTLPLFWGWAYRFEAYTPASKRTRGYYALPLLWRDRVIGWGNISAIDGALHADLGYRGGRAPSDRRFKQALEQELESLRAFLRLPSPSSRTRV